MRRRPCRQRARMPLRSALTPVVVLAFAGAAVVGGPPGAHAHAQVPERARLYEAPRASDAPAIDGDLDDEAWRAAPWTESFVDIRGEGWPAPRWATRARITWDECCLYVAAELEEPHIWATLTDRDAIVYRDHDFEVFLDPDGDGLAYYELEINALGTEFDLFLDKPYSSGGSAHIAWDMEGLRTAVRLDGTLNDPLDEDRGWTVEIAIPWAALRAPDGVATGPEAVPDDSRQGGGRESPDSGNREPGMAPNPGDEWRVNFSRVQWPLVIEDGSYRKAREPVDWSDHPEDNWVWSPQGEIDMHIPEKWGVVRFVEGVPDDLEGVRE